MFSFVVFLCLAVLTMSVVSMNSRLAHAKLCTIPLLGNYYTTGFAEGVSLSGNTAYMVNETYGLLIIDVSDPKKPKLLGSYNTPNFAEVVFRS